MAVTTTALHPQGTTKKKTPAEQIKASTASPLRPKLNLAAQNLSYDPDRVRELRQKEFQHIAQRGRERLGRVFSGPSAGGVTSQQRQFETYEADVVGEESRMLADLEQQAGTEQRANIQAIGQVVSQEELQNLENLRFAAQRARDKGDATGIYVDDQTGRSYHTLTKQAQDAEISIQQRQQALAEKEQQEASGARERGVTVQEQQLVEEQRQFDIEINTRSNEFSQQMGLSQEQFDEARRQFDLGNENEVLRMEQEFGLATDQLSESIRQFNKQFGLENREANRDYWLRRGEATGEIGGQETVEAQRLAEERRQFDAQIDQRSTEFAQQFGLSEDQFEEARRQFDAGNKVEIDRLEGELGLQRQQLSDAMIQFNKQFGLESKESNRDYWLRKDEQTAQETQFAQQLGLSRQQFNEAKRQFNVGNRTELARMGREFGLAEDQLEESIRQFNSEQALRRGEAVGEVGGKETLAAKEQREAAAARAAGVTLEKWKAEESKRQFSTEIDQRNREFAKTLNMDDKQLKEAKRQFNLGRKDEIARLEREFGLEEGQLDEQIRQFNATQTQEVQMRAAELVFQREQLSQQDTQFMLDYYKSAQEEAAKIGIRREELIEAARQYDANEEAELYRFEEELGVERGQLFIAAQQFNRQMTDQEKQTLNQNYQALKQIQIEADKLTEEGRQFDDTLSQRATEFGKQLGLSTNQFKQAAKEWRIGRIDEKTRLAKELGLEEDRLNETIRQFDERIAIDQQQVEQDYGLKKGQLDEQRRQFNIQSELEQARMTGVVENRMSAEALGIVITDEARQNPDLLNWEVSKVFEARMGRPPTRGQLQQIINGETFTIVSGQTLEAQQLNQEYTQRESEFARSLGMDQRQFAETRRQFNLGRTDEIARLEQEFGLRQGQLDESIRQFDEQMDQREVEAARDWEARQAEITGVMGANVSLETLGVQRTNDAVRDSERIRRAFSDQMGRDPTEAEIHSLIQGGTVAVEGVETQAAREARLQRETQIDQFGQQIGLSQDQLAETKREFDREYTQRNQEFAREMSLSEDQLEEAVRQFDAGNDLALARLEQDAGLAEGQLAESIRQFNVQTQQRMAELTGQVQQDISAETLGIPDNLLDVDRRQAIIDAFKDVTGRNPTAAEISSLDSGDTLSTQALTLAAQQQRANMSYEERKLTLSEDQQAFIERMEQADRSGYMTYTNAQGIEVQQETLQAKAQREQNALAAASITGEYNNNKTLAAKNFDEQLRLQGDMDKAKIQQIYAGIAQADTALEQQLTQFLAQKEIDLAGITGFVGVKGEMSAQELGVPLSEDVKAAAHGMWWTLIGGDEWNQASRAFESTFGEAPDDMQIVEMLKGNSIETPKTATLQARQLANTVSAQALDREADMFKFSEQFGLEEERVREAMRISDEQWAQTSQQIAQQMGLNERQFAMAAMQVQAELTGKVGIQGKMTLEDLGLSKDQLETEGLRTWAQKKDRVAGMFEAIQGRAPEDFEIVNLIFRGGTEVESMSTQQAKEFAVATQQAAKDFGLREDQFEEAMNQFNQQFGHNERMALAQLSGVDEKTGNNTVAYQQILDAKNAMAGEEGKRDAIWNELMRKNIGDPTGETVPMSDLVGAELLEGSMEKGYEDKNGNAKYLRIGLEDLGLTKGAPADAVKTAMENRYSGTEVSWGMASQVAGGETTQVNNPQYDTASGKLKLRADPETIDAIVKEAQVAFEDRYGYSPSSQDIRQAMEQGAPIVVREAKWHHDDITEMVNLINGHGMQYSQASSGAWEALGGGMGLVAGIIAAAR